jgi:hypothetical protein
MTRLVLERHRGLALSLVLHGIVCVLALVRPGAEIVTPKVAVVGKVTPIFVPPKRVASESTVGHCSFGLCAGGPQQPDVLPTHLEGPELQFLDDSTHELLQALTRSGGVIAIADKADRTRTLAVYRVADGASMRGDSLSNQFPLRVVVHDPEAYAEIVAQVGRLGVDPDSVRVLGVFPVESQARLYDAIEAEAGRRHLPPGRRRAVVAVSAVSTFGIEIRSVSVVAQSAKKTVELALPKSSG